jgi:photosystem II stability/assembly factor-like uncharacterized protein
MTFFLSVIAEAQKKGGVAAFIDAEHALDPLWAQTIGVKLDELLISQPDTGEQALEIAESLIRSGGIDVLVIDSVAALVPRAEIEGEMGDSVMGMQARLMSQALRKLTAVISKSKTVLIFTNQLRQKIGVMCGNPIFYRVYFINKNIGFLLSIQGSIYKTTDGGKNWSKKLDNPVYSLSDITFIDEKIGYIVGVEYSGGSNKMLLLYTNDSGETWEVTSRVLDNFLPLALSFPTKNIGYFTGVSGKIAKFDAQTLSWTLLHDNSDQSFSYIKFFNEKKGHIVVDNSQEDKSQLLSTDDGGDTWKIKDVSQPIINSIYFSSYQNGIAIGGNHGILKSSNGGENWSQSASRINNAVESIYFKDDQLSGSVVTTIGEVFETKDGGNSWTIYKPIDSVFDNSGRRFLSDIYYQDFENAYAIDNNGQVYKLIKE